MTYTPYQFANNKSTTVAGGAGGLGTTLNPADTTLYVPTGHGADFPSSGYFMIQIGTTEYAKVTLNSADVFTIVRAQEGTTAGTWPVGTTVQQIVSAQALNDGMNELATLDSAKASLSGAAFTGNISTTGTLGVTGAATLSSTAHIVGAATLDSTLAVTGAASLTSTVTKYNNETTAGLGIPYTKSSTQEMHITTTTASQTILSYTVGAADEQLLVGASLTLNNGVSGQAVLLAVTYTNRAGTSAGHRFASVASGATTVVVLDGSTSRTNAEYPCQPYTIVAQAASSVVVSYSPGANTPNDYVTASVVRLS